jgi:hypothetical protein
VAGVPASSRGGGSAAPITRAIYTTPAAAAVDIANDGNAYLPFALFDGSSLLDLTDTAAPVIVTAGTYAVTAAYVADASMTVGGYFTGRLYFGDITLNDDSPAASAVSPSPRLLVPTTYYLPADSVVKVRVYNFDGAALRGFGFTLYLQRLS